MSLANTPTGSSPLVPAMRRSPVLPIAAPEPRLAALRMTKRPQARSSGLGEPQRLWSAPPADVRRTQAQQRPPIISGDRRSLNLAVYKDSAIAYGQFRGKDASSERLH